MQDQTRNQKPKAETYQKYQTREAIKAASRAGSQAVCESSESGQPAKQDFVAQIMRYRCCQTGKGFD